MNCKKRIAGFQNKRSWSLNRLATEAELNPGTVTNWFSRNSTPTVEALEKICVAFGITLSEFFNETEETTVLTLEQKEMLAEWDCLTKNEKADLLQFIKTLNIERQKGF